MKIILFTLFLAFAPSTWAQIDSERTVTSSLNVKTQEEAKVHLLHSAVLEAIKQYASEFGIDSQAFNSKLEEKFKTWFDAYKSRSLSEKFGKNYSSELTNEQKKTFLDAIEARRTQEFIRFAKLDQLLDSYAFKHIASDPTAPEKWTAKVILNLNRIKLERMNNRLMSQETKLYSKLFLISEVNLFGMNWPDLGLDKNTTFTDPLMASWNKWLASNQPSNVDEIVLCTGVCLGQFASWQQLPQETGMKVPEEVLNSLWLKVSYNLRRLSYVKNINEWSFEWDGSVILLDSNTKRIIASYTLSTETKVWRGFEQKVLNSKLASSMYRSPLDAFSKITKKIQESPRLNRLSRLVISGHQHLGDVVLLMEELKKAGQKINFEVQIDVFSQKEAQLLCFYQGEEKSFTDLLSQVKELKSSHSYRVVNEFTGIHHVLKLVAE